MKIQFHTQKGIVEVDSETVTDTKLTKLGITREALEKLLPPSFNPPTETGLPEKVEYIEQFLKERYP